MPNIHTAIGGLSFGHNRVKHEPDDPVLVFVHGAGGQRADWPQSWRNAGGDFRQIATYTLDLPGHDVDGGTGHDTVEAYTDAVGAFLDAMGFTRAVIVGHSMGAAIVLLLGIRHHPRVAGLVTIGGGAEFPVTDAVLNGFKTNFEATVDVMVRFSWPRHARESYKRQQRWHMRVAGPTVVHDDFLACQRFNANDRLADIAVPVLIIAAKDDRMVPLKKSIAIHEGIAESRMVTVANSGHFPQTEQRRKCVGAIEGFLRDLK